MPILKDTRNVFYESESEKSRSNLIKIKILWFSDHWYLFCSTQDIALPEDPAILLLGIYPRDTPIYNKDACTTMFIAALFIIDRSWIEPIYPSVDEWIQKLWYICTMEYYSAINNNDFTKFLRKWMHLENIILSEVTQSQKNRQNMQSLIIGN